MRLKKRISTALVTALVLPLGLGVSFGAGAVEEVVDTVYVDRASFFPVEVKGTETVANQYNGWHQGDNNGAGNYKFTDYSIDLTAKAQILYGNDGKGAEDAIAANVAEVAGSLAVAGENTADLWYQIPVFFGDLEGSPSFTTLRKPVTATDEQWTLSGKVGDLAGQSTHDITVINAALGEHLVIGYGFYAGIGSTAQVTSFTALGVEHKFTPAPVVPEPEEPETPDPKPTPPPAAKFEQVVPSGDLNGDGFADLLAVDNSGVLWLYPGKSGDAFSKPVRLGSGWSNRVISSPGDFNGDGIGDLIAVDDKGDLYFYPGKGNGNFGAANQVGWGWGDLEIIPAGDVTGDGVSDVLAIDSDGFLYYYAGDGNGQFKGKLTKVGQGWYGYDLYPAGDINGDGLADILSIDRNGNLFTHLGKEGGAFRKSFQSGKGWSTYELFAGSDANGDGLAALYGRDSKGDLYFYAGKPSGGFRTAVLVGKGW